MSSRPPQQLNFRVSPRVLAPLGLEQLHDPALAVLELIKNSWDAGATRVLVEVRTKSSNPEIVVTDNGAGMTVADFRDRWLVIGASHKRGAEAGRGSRPLIGEKGLGRLASYALGSSLRIQSSVSDDRGFIADVNWDSLLRSPSVEDYKVSVEEHSSRKGTTVSIQKMRATWTEDSTDFLAMHAQFLTSVPGERFAIIIKVDGKSLRVRDPLETIAQISEGEFEVEVQSNGLPKVTRAVIAGVDLTKLQYRDISAKLIDRRLAGTRLHLKFYRRDQAVKKLSSILSSNEVSAVLERYQGVRIYRDGINVPPYGLNGNDWASLEKQRTATGGPTMVPGNSQLTGELRLPASAKHLAITAGRSGFAEQSAVKTLADYVRWAVKELGTARRAEALGIKPGQRNVPGRVDAGSRDDQQEKGDPLQMLREVVGERAVKSDPDLKSKLNVARKAVEQELDRNEQTLRLYAQLASTGIAATSFAHELRTDFDVVTEAVAQLEAGDSDDGDEVVELLANSWARITNFVALFRVLPVKVRRQRRALTAQNVRSSVEAVAGLAPQDRITVKLTLLNRRLFIVPAEFDSILLNLVSNAIKAIGEGRKSGSGRIRVVVADRGSDLEIAVADNGCGVSKQVAQTMFEPLEGKFAEGTGMGLPIVKFIADRYEGAVSLSKAPPNGYATEIKVLLRGVVR